MTREQIRDYCECRRLRRPGVHWSVPCLLILIGEVAARLLAHWVGSVVWAELIVLALLGRWTLILAVKAYQRYAPEEMRRRCCCYPSCSEYAIATLRRHGLLVGGIRAAWRVLVTCRDEYLEDLPYKNYNHGTIQ